MIDEPSSGLMSIALLLLVLLVPVAFLGLLFLLLRAAARIRQPDVREDGRRLPEPRSDGNAEAVSSRPETESQPQDSTESLEITCDLASLVDCGPMPFFERLGQVPSDQPDVVGIDNNAEIADANRMQAGPEQVDRFRELHGRYPDSGNVCALYAQALLAAGQRDEALSMATRSIPRVQRKSQVARFLGQTFLLHGGPQLAPLADCIKWFVIAVELLRGKSEDLRFVLPYLACVYWAVGKEMKNWELEAVGNNLLSSTDLGPDDALKQTALERAHAYCDSSIMYTLELAARRYQW